MLSIKILFKEEVWFSKEFIKLIQIRITARFYMLYTLQITQCFNLKSQLSTVQQYPRDNIKISSHYLTLTFLLIVSKGKVNTIHDKLRSKDNARQWEHNSCSVGSHMWWSSITQAGLRISVASNCHSGLQFWLSGPTSSSEQEHPGENKEFQHELWPNGQGVKSAAGELLVWVHAGKICVGKVNVTTIERV